MDGGNYSRLDRLLHRAAFGGIELQKAVADIEDRTYAADLSRVTVARPVFVTSLPRAGTTLLLESIAALPGFATHTYRNMPFVLCPLLWERISRPFRKPSVLQDRAHGDGMAVGFDSPEAFEKVLWKAFWPKKYRRAAIAMWDATDCDAEFEAFFRAHMGKLILSRGGFGARYLSKNNANIARLPLLARLFPDCTIIVPFRNPLDQAMSLLRQHRHFSALHAASPFVRAYMEDLGHLEFGAAFRPLEFPDAPAAAPDHLAFWLGYWVAAFSHVLAYQISGYRDDRYRDDIGVNLRLVDFDGLCAHPEPSLRILGDILGNTGEADGLAARARFFHAARSYGSPAGADLRLALDLHQALRARAVN